MDDNKQALLLLGFFMTGLLMSHYLGPEYQQGRDDMKQELSLIIDACRIKTDPDIYIFRVPPKSYLWLCPEETTPNTKDCLINPPIMRIPATPPNTQTGNKKDKN